jgi:flagellar basal body rod protein FlgC
MSGLFGSLSIALSGLSVSQQEMETTSNNVANANTPGYTREVPVTAAGDPVEIGSLSIGTGVVLDKDREPARPDAANPNQSGYAAEQLTQHFADATAADSNPVRERHFRHRRRHQQFLQQPAAAFPDPSDLTCGRAC